MLIKIDALRDLSRCIEALVHHIDERYKNNVRRYRPVLLGSRKRGGGVRKLPQLLRNRSLAPVHAIVLGRGMARVRVGLVRLGVEVQRPTATNRKSKDQRQQAKK